MTDPDLPSADDYVALGRALRKLRRAAKLTQKQAASTIGVGATFISQIENGHRGMRWHTLLAFLAAYGTDLHALADAIKGCGVGPSARD
ncbi:MAG TPA: helix-turn-helix transcriptional regulator [Solirubrobacteraceae bacterium]|jgi:transcriptional regulator with XRE-family HTH domain|nr:helix-turn-helix transcriptional regulator [Solirubrobacteraceae bacterium]